MPVHSSVANLNGCSALSIARSMWGHLLAVHDDLFVYRTFPFVNGEHGSEWRYREDDPLEIDHPRHKIVKMTYLPVRYDQAGAVVSREWLELFGALHGKYVIDAVVNEAPISTPAIAKAVSFYNRQKDTHLPIVNKDPYVLERDEYGFVNEPDEISQTLGYLLGWNIATSQGDLELMMRTASRFLNIKSLERLRQRTIVQPGGTNCDLLDSLMQAPGFRKHERFTVAMIDRFSSPTNHEKTLATLDAVFASGKDMDLQITTLNKSSVKAGWDPDRYSWMTIYWACPRFRYLELMPKCHALLNMSDKHSYPQGLSEALYCGLVCVLPNKHWCRVLFGDRANDYPFLFDSINEAGAMIRYIRENYDAAKAMVAWVPAWIRATYDTRVCAERTYAFIAHAVAENRAASEWPGLADLLETCRKRLGRRFSWEGLIRACRQFSETGLHVGSDKGMFSTTGSQLYFETQKLQWPDNCKEALPYFEFPVGWTPSYTIRPRARLEAGDDDGDEEATQHPRGCVQLVGQGSEEARV